MSVICITAVGTLISMLIPDGEGGGISRSVRLIYGICVVFVCIYPIKNIINTLQLIEINDVVGDYEQNTDDYMDILNSSYGAAEIENLKSGIKQMLFDEFGIENSECKVSVSLDQERSLSRVLITLYGSAIWKDTGEIERVLGGMLSCEIVTAIG